MWSSRDLSSALEPELRTTGSGAPFRLRRASPSHLGQRRRSECHTLSQLKDFNHGLWGAEPNTVFYEAPAPRGGRRPTLRGKLRLWEGRSYAGIASELRVEFRALSRILKWFLRQGLGFHSLFVPHGASTSACLSLTRPSSPLPTLPTRTPHDLLSKNTTTLSCLLDPPTWCMGAP